MDIVTFDSLNEIHARHPKEFGKVCQILLAIAFYRLGFRRVVERSVQGVDIDISDHATFTPFSIEVKTTIYNTVQIGQKDVEGLQVRNRDGYETAFAILRLGLLSEWIIAKAKSIPAGDIRIGRFEVHAIRDLQDRVNEAFPSVVADHARELLMKRTDEVQMYLQQRLEYAKRKAEKTSIDINIR